MTAQIAGIASADPEATVAKAGFASADGPEAPVAPQRRRALAFRRTAFVQALAAR